MYTYKSSYFAPLHTGKVKKKQGEVYTLMLDAYNRKPKASGNARRREENPAQQLGVGGIIAHYLSMP